MTSKNDHAGSCDSWFIADPKLKTIVVKITRFTKFSIWSKVRAICASIGELSLYSNINIRMARMCSEFSPLSVCFRYSVHCPELDQANRNTSFSALIVFLICISFQCDFSMLIYLHLTDVLTGNLLIQRTLAIISPKTMSFAVVVRLFLTCLGAFVIYVSLLFTF